MKAVVLLGVPVCLQTPVLQRCPCLQPAHCSQPHLEASSAYPPAACSASLKIRSTSWVWIPLVSFPNDPLGHQGQRKNFPTPLDSIFQTSHPWKRSIAPVCVTVTPIKCLAETRPAPKVTQPPSKSCVCFSGTNSKAQGRRSPHMISDCASAHTTSALFACKNQATRDNLGWKVLHHHRGHSGSSESHQEKCCVDISFFNVIKSD